MTQIPKKKKICKKERKRIRMKKKLEITIYRVKTEKRHKQIKKGRGTSK